MVKGGMCGEGGHEWQKGGCMVCTPPQDTASHCAGGTHPTGMHSCYLLQTKLREGNFLHLSVIVFTGRWGSLSRGGVSLQGGSLSASLCQGDPRTVKSGWYSSYRNAFLFSVRSNTIYRCP